MASIATLQQMLECPACHDTYTQPQLLTCLHTVCATCLDNLHDDDVTHVTCPVCDHVSAQDEIRQDINKEQLLQVCSAQQESEHSHGNKLDGISEDMLSDAEADQMGAEGPNCELCDKGIAWFCNECNQWFCNECKARHAKTTATKLHKLEHLNKVAKKHRARLEQHYFTIKRAHERVTKLIGNLDGELLNAEAVLGAALFTTKEMRQDWLDRINHYFDSLDVKIADFANSRILDLKRLRERLETQQLDLSKKTIYLSDYMSQYNGVIISTSGEVTRDIANYITDTQVPSVELKPFNVKVTRGRAFDGKQIASVEMFGAHSVMSAPLAPNNYDNHKQDTKTHRKQKQFEAYPKPTQKTPRKRPEDPLGSDPSLKQSSPRRTPVPKGKQTRKTPVPVNLAAAVESGTPAPTRVESLRQFAKGARLRREAEVLLTASPGGISFIDGLLWVAQENCITLWNTDLEEKRVLGHQLIKGVNNCARMKKGGYLAACDSGLHMFTSTYKYNGRITDETVSDVATSQHYVYAALCKEKVRVRINVYDERVADWSVTRVIRTAVPGRASLLVVEDKLYVCSAELGTVTIMNLQGEVIKKAGRKGKYGSAGELNEPRICMADYEHTVLFCDVKNANFQIMAGDQHWDMIQLQDTAVAPSGACFVKRRFFIVQGGTEPKLLKYEA